MSDKPSFVYVTYIDSTPEKVWHALVDPEHTKHYWGRHRNASDWEEGSEWRHEDYDDPSKVDIVGEVVTSDPPRRLVVTWAEPKDAGDPEKTSRVTYEVEPFHGTVRLTVRHEELEPGSDMLDGVTAGWPMVLASLKTLLETGDTFEMSKRRWEATPE